MIQKGANGWNIDHAPSSKLDYGFNWEQWLAGDTITDSDWEVDSSDITLSNQNISGSITSVFAEGGLENKKYVLLNTITTSGGRIDSRSLTLVCKIR